MGVSSGGGNAQRDAERAEQARQAQIAATTGQVNAIYDSPDRARQRTDFGAALRDYYMQDANRQKTQADRDLKFSLARSGLTGGSRQIDANRTAGEEWQRGILEADRKVQGGVADLLGRDEQARANLLGLAQGGLNATAAAQQAAGSLRANLEGANASARVQGIGDIFGSVAETRRRSEEGAERRRADAAYTQQYSPWFSFGGGG